MTETLRQPGIDRISTEPPDSSGGKGFLMTVNVTMRRATIFLVLILLFISLAWYGFVTSPSRPTEVYSSGSRLILLIPATIFWSIAAGSLLHKPLRREKSAGSRPGDFTRASGPSSLRFSSGRACPVDPIGGTAGQTLACGEIDPATLTLRRFKRCNPHDRFLSVRYSNGGRLGRLPREIGRRQSRRPLPRSPGRGEAILAVSGGFARIRHASGGAPVAKRTTRLTKPGGTFPKLPRWPPSG